MPRPSRGTLVPLTLIVVLLAVAAPASIEGALASAAGTVLEALPFVVGSALLPRVRALRFLPSLGCGCGSSLPAALALPALALTWISFGPLVTVARALASIVVGLASRRRTATRDVPARDPPGELATLAAASFGGSLLAEAIGVHPHLAYGGAGTALSLLLGAIAGGLAPCATAGIGAAVALRAADPWASIGLLATSGVVALRFPAGSASRERSARLSYAALALAALFLCARGTHGLINPRFALVAPLGACVATLAALRATTTRSRFPLLAPGAILAALIFGAPPPHDWAATIPFDLYPGRRVAFTGRVARNDAVSTTLVRPAILCCRADARLLSLQLDRRIEASGGAWLDVRGTVTGRNGELVVHLESARVVAAPADPYIYF